MLWSLMDCDPWSKTRLGREKKQPFEWIEVTRDQALEIFSENQFKVEIIKDLPEDKTVTVCRCGPLVYLCRGPHSTKTSFVKASPKAWSPYCNGNKDRESLKCVYGISYPQQERLKEDIDMLEEAKKYDHKNLAKKQKLYHFHRQRWRFLDKGMGVYRLLLEFVQFQYSTRGYQEVEKREFGRCLKFDCRDRSYSELPLRYVDFGESGVPYTRKLVTGVHRDDMCIYCRESQVKDEVKGVLEFISCVYGIFGCTFDLKLSTRPEKYLGDIETWDLAEKSLREALDEFGKPWQINEADGAFYGPKIDISIFDAMRRKLQCATLQLEFQIPCLNLTHLAEDESKRERPVMIRGAIFGFLDRLFAILLEHYKGKWPFWLSPRQAIVCPISDKSQPYGLELVQIFNKAGFQVHIDTSDKTIQKKVKEAESIDYNFILVVGEEEANTKHVCVRVRDSAAYARKSIEELLQYFKDEILSYH